MVDLPPAEPVKQRGPGRPRKHPLPAPKPAIAEPPRKASAKDVIGWIERKCLVPEGLLIGRGFKLAEWQKECLRDIYDNPAGTRRAILSFGRKNGKALDLRTPIPTPRGWTTMGELRVGDHVFDERGAVCHVTYKSPVFIGHQCWRLTFADGSSIVADDEHQWLTRHSYRPWAQARVNASGRGGRWRSEIVTTRQIAESLLRSRFDGGREHNHKLAVAQAIETPEADLSIPPYVLGYWLGNGNTVNASITIGPADADEIRAQVEAELGFELSARKVAVGDAPTFALSRGRSLSDRLESVQTRLRTIGVFGDKHIPHAYLWASRAQRLALLQGLMDSDGSVSGNPKALRCYFDNTNERVARDTLQLVRSLGFKASLREDRATLHGRDIGPAYSVHFTAYREDKVFRLRRKLDRLGARTAKKRRSASNAIVGCDEVASVPTVCIQVDSPSHLFLAGEGFTPTHNTALAALLLLVHLCGPKYRPNSQLFSTAQSREQAALIFQLAAKIVRMSPELRDAIQVKEAAKELLCADLGTRYRALSAEASTAYGLSPVFHVADELGQVKGPRSALYEALETATGANETPLTVIISTQAPTDADLLSILIDDAVAGNDKRTVCRLYTAPKHLDPFDVDTIIQANPAFGTFLNPTEVVAMAEDARRMPSREAEFRNLILNQRVQVNNPYITPEIWKENAALPGGMTDEMEFWGGLDLSETADLTALVLIGKNDKGKWGVHPTFWLPEANLFEKSVGDRVPYDQWAAEGWLTTTPGRTVKYEWVANVLHDLLSTYNIRKIGFDRWHFDHLKSWLIKSGLSEKYIDEHFVAFGQGYQSMSPALRALEEILRDGALAHGNNPILSMCVANTVITLDDAGNRKPSKRKSTGRIDGLVALAIAAGVAPLRTKEIDIEGMVG